MPYKLKDFYDHAQASYLQLCVLRLRNLHPVPCIIVSDLVSET